MSDKENVPRKEWSEAAKNQAIGIWQSATKDNQRAPFRKLIEEQTGIPPSTFDKILRKYKQTLTACNNDRGGRPKLLTPRATRALVNFTKKNRTVPFSTVRANVTPEVSTSTVTRALHSSRVYRRKARKVPALSKNQTKQRLLWGRQHKRFSDADWRHVIWSDECYISAGDMVGNLYVSRTTDEELDPSCTFKTWKQSNVRCMVWACIMVDDIGPIVVLHYPGGRGGGMNTTRYIP